ncbi:FAD-dependent oxidoreductase [Ochrobactrum sp. POC9]|uniref:NAD(P)/FAD-dependent oxidoreductase n=1 Tax=unclassified Ochrobactrum TaxID=239106 RepID=UPI000D7060E9|nr:FAD-dependent oxidoreductase [Ochrobactrum sp. POC9]MCH4543317.1 FAD-binding oxidoreductase [Ochrobactrum sp. A-1]PWU70891.1 FAD-dependent oxidoreductase [Ochrobactrum sp. POC9]
MQTKKSGKLTVAVIGAGVVGLSTARWLQKKGLDVVLVDPTPPLSDVSFRNAASFGNAATVAPSGIFPTAAPGILWKVPGMLLRRDGPLTLYWRDLLDLAPWLAAFLSASLRSRQDGTISALGSLMKVIEEGHAPLMEEVGGIRFGRGTGSIHLYRTEEEAQNAKKSNDRRRAEGIEAQYLLQDEIAAMEPNLARGYIGGTIFPGCFVVDSPEAYCRGLAQAIQKHGGRFVTAKAERIESGTDGVRIRTGGEVISADRIVISAGAWSRGLSNQLGDRLNMNTERGYHVAFEHHEPLLTHPVMYPSDGFFLTPLSHQIRAAGTVDLGGLDKPARQSRLDVLENKARRMLPALGDRQDTWMGFRPSTPDSLPFIGPSRKDPRIIYACGHGHLGLTLGGITGKFVSELMTGDKPSIDLSPFSPARSMLRLN